MGEPLLREFLATRDHTCERCGYNLRSISEPFCPECGYVIPRPGTDALEGAMVGTRPGHRLWCLHCQYPVHDVSGDVCPGCGKSLVMEATRFEGKKPRRILGVPVRLVLECLVCLVFALRPAVLLAQAIAKGDSSRIQPLMLAVAVILLPIVLLVGWWRVSARVKELGAGTYWMLSVAVHVAALACLVLGTRMY